MSNTVIITGILLILAIGGLAVPLGRLLFKKSIVFKVFVILLLPILGIAIAGFIVGATKNSHLMWVAPIALAILFTGWHLVKTSIQKPMNEMQSKTMSLAEGNVNVSFDGKYAKGSTEIAQMMRMLAKLTESLKNVAAFALHIGKGELGAQYELRSENDTLGKSMLEMRDNLQVAEDEKKKRQQEDENRNWITVGLAKFAEILRANNHNIEELCHTIISNLVKYTGANQGGIFVLNDDDSGHPVLEMLACYAYERRKFTEKTVEMGEGLVGTCFLERESIYMTEIPHDYINITSGLGHDTPRALLITPLKLNEDIYGVIEIASFNEFAPHVRELIEKLAESIASTIGSVKVNIRTSRLLEQSKLQAEEMANQEEELRQNMEEMQATQEEMRRRESELQETLSKMEELQAAGKEQELEMKQFHDAIFGSNNVVEFDNNATITDVNQNLLNLFGVDRSFFIGKHLRDVVGEQAYQEAHKHVGGQKKTYEDVQTITTSDGERKSVRQRFIPIINTEGKLNKVLLLVFDETHIEEMRQQEEELRQNMEEMQATQEEMRRRETELADLNFETEQLQNTMLITSNVVTISPEGIIIDVNNNIVNSFEGTKKADFVGKPVEAFIGKEDMKKAVTSCNRGESYESVQKLPTGPNRMTTFRQKFIPIRSKDGKLLRIMLIANDETYIEEMNRREVEFKEKANWYESMLNSFEGTPVSVTDMNRNVTFLNTPALQILGKTLDEVIGKPCAEVWNMDICGNEKCGIECMLCGKGKSVFHTDTNTYTTQASYIKDLNGNNIGHIEVVADITEVDHRFASINMVQQISKIGMWDLKIDKGDAFSPNSVLIWSDDIRRLLGGYTKDEFPDELRSLIKVLHPEDKDKAQQAFSEHLRDLTGKTPYDLIVRILKKNGEYGYYHAFGVTTRNPQGIPLLVTGAMQDVTDVKAEKNELQAMVEQIQKLQTAEAEKKQWFESILDEIPVRVFVTDTDMNFTFVNRATEEFLGKMRQEVIGKPCNIANTEICQTENCAIDCVKRGIMQTKFYHNGTRYYVISSALKDAEGNVIGYIEMVREKQGK